MSLIYLIAAGMAEVIMVFCLKKSDGFKKKSWTLSVILAASTSFFLLSKAMTTAEAGVAYSIWVAFGSIGSVLLGTFFFNEKLSKGQLLSLLLILCSVIGLELF